MNSQIIFANLRDILAYLYIDEASARRIADDAGLDARTITFTHKAIEDWHAILTEAVKINRLDAVLDVVSRSPYREFPKWEEVYEAYRRFVDAGQRIELPVVLQPEQDAPAPGKSPFKGLEVFDEGDTHLFFGREQLTAELIHHLWHHQFLALVGASGSGKSSLLNAGLLPALKSNVSFGEGSSLSAGNHHSRIFVIRPTPHPLKALATELTKDSDSIQPQRMLIDEMAADARSLDLYIYKTLANESQNRTTGQRVLLVVDQFEEIFTLCQDRIERKMFVDNLLNAATADGVTTVLIASRADFYVHCFEFDNLLQMLERYQKHVRPMNKEELRRAVEKPAEISGWSFERNLVDLLLADVKEEPGNLPLLSHALLETWNNRRGRTLTLRGYLESGRVQGAIAKTAETVFRQHLTKNQQAIAQNIFLRLTELGDGAADTRRRAEVTIMVPKN